MNRLNKLIVIFIFTLILFGCQPKNKENFSDEEIDDIFNKLTKAQQEQYLAHDSCLGKDNGSSCNYCYHLTESGDDCMCEKNEDKNIMVCRLNKNKQEELQNASNNFCKNNENEGKSCYYCGNDGDNNIKKKNCACKDNICQLK